MASLTFDGVGKTFGENVVAIANVSFKIDDGEFVVLVGPSGCGKSTLLRIAAGLEELSGGRLLMDEADVTARGPEDRDIAMVFQNYALYPHMSVYENMAFGLRQRKMPKAEIDRLVREAAEMLDLSRYLDRKPGALSGGQRQRVAMGRAIVRHPACFLMDEPLSNLDAKLRVQMRSELKLLNQRLGVTTLYVTHDQVEAMTMGDRVAVLQPIGHAGESNLQQIDTPQVLYDRPATMFVAGFIGSPAMNFLRAELRRDGEALEASVAGTGQRFRVPATPALAAYAGRAVVVGIRPEAFEVTAPEEAVFHEPIPVAEALGADTFVFFDIDSPPVGIADIGEEANLTAKGRSRLVARIPPARTPRANERLPLRIDLARLHWFDPASGLAIRD
ncbi:glycerol-3-phosphate ABC transporter ATP-binding protein [Aureimonas endophytica]|uniref:Glycerol-3-phosphate ABC transporter ATP-binding protein n=1 Tax=Aureimonas endophytica TaxID=2027858 RepID=A0A917E8N3_9HYPH|nr:sn-glycerol-3-phosphate ABC transporter ATP-binding protein UgpC [Aureimonas endophytica]GGE15030.1 glycerol-3-phosphate ABC transporter ATP-binding protein [Aureimonas endophytica]